MIIHVSRLNSCLLPCLSSSVLGMFKPNQFLDRSLRRSICWAMRLSRIKALSCRLFLDRAHPRRSDRYRYRRWRCYRGCAYFIYRDLCSRSLPAYLVPLRSCAVVALPSTWLEKIQDDDTIQPCYLPWFVTKIKWTHSVRVTSASICQSPCMQTISLSCFSISRLRCKVFRLLRWQCTNAISMRNYRVTNPGWIPYRERPRRYNHARTLQWFDRSLQSRRRFYQLDYRGRFNLQGSCSGTIMPR